MAASTHPALCLPQVVLGGAIVIIEAQGVGKTARCPACGTESDRLHDQDVRRPRE
ncbi:MAG: hypothetical protein ACR2PL_07510 [Dehalococcoidia bacterium]